MTTDGSDGRSQEIRALVRTMEDAVNRHDVEAMMAVCSDDIVWDTTTPPEGQRFEGAAAVREAGAAFFAASSSAHFETEEIIALGDAAVSLWRYSWTNASGPGHVRGVDVILVRDGKITSIQSYVKG
jgi:uncharacterized protein (TIGR02246 family)